MDVLGEVCWDVRQAIVLRLHLSLEHARERGVVSIQYQSNDVLLRHLGQLAGKDA